ncbi:MAG TPA: PDZ domain-containing protein [Acetobacteraceae bacterium]|nr:PDZ domain-containing protein [Acetobacteraceae bacterium]
MAGVIAALHASNIILPAPAVIERSAIAGRARARKRMADAVLVDLSAEQLAKLDALLVIEPSTGLSQFAWLKAFPTAAKGDNIEELVERLRVVRAFGLAPDLATRIHPDRFRQLVREAALAEAHQLNDHVVHQRRALQVALLLDLKTRLTDTALDIADKLIGRLFARAKRAQEKCYVANSKSVGRLMRMFRGTIAALGTAQETDRDGSTQDASPAMQVPPNLGLSLSTLTLDLRAHYGLQMGQVGVLIGGVAAGTDAFDRGLVPGDVILRVQGTEVGAPQQVQAAIDAARAQHKTFILALVLPKVQQIPGPRWLALRVTPP